MRVTGFRLQLEIYALTEKTPPESCAKVPAFHVFLSAATAYETETPPHNNKQVINVGSVDTKSIH